MKKYLMFLTGALCAAAIAGCCCGKCDKVEAPAKTECRAKKCCEKGCCPKCKCPEKKCCPKCECPKAKGECPKAKCGEPAAKK